MGNRVIKMKILVEVMHGMGDVVCALPMLKEIKTYYPESELTVLVNKSEVVDIISCSDVNVEHFVCINSHINKIKVLRQCLGLRKEKFDLAVACANTPVKKSKFLMGVIHAKRTFGIQYEYGKNYDQLNDKYHFIDAHVMALDGMKIKKHGFLPRLNAREKDLGYFKQIFEKGDKVIVGICIGRADVSYKNRKKRTGPVYTRGWGDLELHSKNMAAIIQKCLDIGWKVVLLGGKAELEIRDKFSQEVIQSKEVFDLVGKTTIAESIAIVSLCDTVLGVDTGMQHIADAVGVPTVSIFGPTNPKTHGAFSDKALFAEVKEPCRFCYGTFKYISCNNRKCMTKITPGQVFTLLQMAVNQ